MNKTPPPPPPYSASADFSRLSQREQMSSVDGPSLSQNIVDGSLDKNNLEFSLQDKIAIKIQNQARELSSLYSESSLKSRYIELCEAIIADLVPNIKLPLREDLYSDGVYTKKRQRQYEESQEKISLQRQEIKQLQSLLKAEEQKSKQLLRRISDLKSVAGSQEQQKLLAERKTKRLEREVEGLEKKLSLLKNQTNRNNAKGRESERRRLSSDALKLEEVRADLAGEIKTLEEENITLINYIEGVVNPLKQERVELIGKQKALESEMNILNESYRQEQTSRLTLETKLNVTKEEATELAQQLQSMQLERETYRTKMESFDDTKAELVGTLKHLSKWQLTSS